jgi:acetate kinase
MHAATESRPSAPGREAASADELAALDAYRRAANVLGAAQVYLRDNALLEEPLPSEHIKPRLLGHRGMVYGINMSTRSGDVDPGLVHHLILRGGMNAADVQELLSRKNWLLGLSGRSGDIRDLEPAGARGDRRAALALEVQAYRVRKDIGAYAAAPGGVDALALSGALAENSAALRGRVFGGLEFLGIRLDAARNRVAGPVAPSRISTDDSAVPVWVVPAGEERQIARVAAGLLDSRR